MGGLIILAAILIPTLLFAKLSNIYIVIMIISTLGWVLLVLDDYIKVFKKTKEGLAGKFKIIGQVGLGLIIGLILYFHDRITIKEKISNDSFKTTELVFGEETKSLKTTIPFVKNNEFNYTNLLSWIGEGAIKYGLFLY